MSGVLCANAALGNARAMPGTGTTYRTNHHTAEDEPAGQRTGRYPGPYAEPE